MRVRVINTCTIGNDYHKEGEEFEYDGPPNKHLLPLDKPAAAEKPKHEEPDEDEPESKHYLGKKK